jgi:hypothetical protein
MSDVNNNAVSGQAIKTTYHDMDGDNAMLVKEYSMDDIKAVAESSKKLASVYGNGGEDKLVMSVHPAIVMAWCEKRGITINTFMCDQKLINEFLGSPDNSHFRVWKGKV